MKTNPMLKTVADMEQAVIDGDVYCKCGYRKSRHSDGTHPAIDPHTNKCNAHGFQPSIGFNHALLVGRAEVEMFPEGAA
jgi:hypothetical protein